MRRSGHLSTHGPQPLRRVGGYAEYGPPAHLSAYVRCLWTYLCHPGGAVSKNRVLTTVVILLGPVRHARAYEPKVGPVPRECPQNR
jgi:hypothetical protein